MYYNLEERTLNAIKEKNINWFILEDITNDEFGNNFEYWSCAESLDFSKRDEDWHSAIYINNENALKLICQALSPFSRVYLSLEGKPIN